MSGIQDRFHDRGPEKEEEQGSGGTGHSTTYPVEEVE
jgi:hypothetical protein